MLLLSMRPKGRLGSVKNNQSSVIQMSMLYLKTVQAFCEEACYLSLLLVDGYLDFSLSDSARCLVLPHKNINSHDER